MAHHVHALLVRAGESTKQALEAALRHEEEVEGEPLDPGREARKRSIAATLSQSRLGYEVLEHEYDEIAEGQKRPEDQVRREIRHVHVDNGQVHVDIDEEHVTLSVPYAEAIDVDAMTELVFDTLRLLRDEAQLGGFYDPQLERELDVDADREAFAEAFRKGLEQAREDGDPDELEQQPRPPWWRRLLRLGR